MLFESSLASLATALSFFVALHHTSCAVVPAQQFPVLPRQTNSSNSSASLSKSAKKFYANALCTPEQLIHDRENWNDASQFADALSLWEVNGSYQATMDIYMGNDSRGPLGDILEANIVGAVDVHNLSTWPDKQKLFILCEEPTELMTEMYGPGCDNSTMAYEFDDFGTYFENHYIVFCPSFYELQPMIFQVIGLAFKMPDFDIGDFLGSQGEIYFHESLHLAGLTTPLNHSIVDGDIKGSSRQEGDPIYGPMEVIAEAKENNTGSCIHIADAYSCAAAAIWAQWRFDLPAPPLPLKNTVSSEKLVRSPIKLLSRGRKLASSAKPHFPDPDTEDNHIEVNSLDFAPPAVNPFDFGDSE